MFSVFSYNVIVGRFFFSTFRNPKISTSRVGITVGGPRVARRRRAFRRNRGPDQSVSVRSTGRRRTFGFGRSPKSRRFFFFFYLKLFLSLSHIFFKYPSRRRVRGHSFESRTNYIIIVMPRIADASNDLTTGPRSPREQSLERHNSYTNVRPNHGRRFPKNTVFYTLTYRLLL